MPTPPLSTRGPAVAGALLGGLSAVSASTGLLTRGGSGPETVTTARGEQVTLLGDGLYAADSLLVGTGNQGQDVVLLLVEVPVLLVALTRWRRGRPLSGPVLAGVLSFFAYYWTSMTFATAQNGLFGLYVACFGLSWGLLVTVLARTDTPAEAAAMPSRPGRRALVGYLVAVAAALTFAWLPALVVTALDGSAAEHVGPYTSAATEALDLALVVPVVVLAVVWLLRGSSAGRLLALGILVLNVCIGVLLLGQGVAQLVGEVPLTTGEIVGKMASFAVLTLVAGGLLLRMWRSATVTSS